MRLTDQNIDAESAKYWFFLSDKTMKDALKSIVKSSRKQNAAKKQVDESIAGTVAATAASIVLWDVLDRAYQNLTDTTKLETYKETIDGMRNNAYLDADTLNTELSKLKEGEFYKLVQASYIIRNYGQETEKNLLSKPALGYERYSAEKQTTTSDMFKNTAYRTSPIEDAKEQYGLFSGRDLKHDTETIKAAYKFLSNFNPTQIAAATAVDITIDNSIQFLKKPTMTFNFGAASSNNSEEKDFRDQMDPLTISKSAFISGKVDYDRRTIEYLEQALKDGKLQAEVKGGEIHLADNLEKLNGVAHDSPKENPEEKKSEEKSEENSEEKNVQQSIKDSPSIQQNSSAVAWIAAAAAAAVAIPYLWKHLASATREVKKEKLLAKCQFTCTDNGQSYQFGYDLRNFQWILTSKSQDKIGNEEARSFAKTKFAKKFADAVEAQMKSFYSESGSKLVYKAIEAAGKDKAKLIKLLYDNRQKIEDSLYNMSSCKPA